eukprot:2049642-Pleurochrysis_carterae.AAC.1
MKKANNAFKSLSVKDDLINEFNKAIPRKVRDDDQTTYYTCSSAIPSSSRPASRAEDAAKDKPEDAQQLADDEETDEENLSPPMSFLNNHPSSNIQGARRTARGRSNLSQYRARPRLALPRPGIYEPVSGHRCRQRPRNTHRSCGSTPAIP